MTVCNDSWQDLLPSSLRTRIFQVYWEKAIRNNDGRIDHIKKWKLRIEYDSTQTARCFFFTGHATKSGSPINSKCALRIHLDTESNDVINA